MTTSQPRYRFIHRRLAIGAAAICLGVTGCTSGDSPGATDTSTATTTTATDSPTSTDTPTSTDSPTGLNQTATIDVDRRFAVWADGMQAITYDADAVPVGATASVDIEPRGSGVKVDLDVDRLQPNRSYGAHIHVSPCGPSGDDAGPHYQDQKDPKTPSTDPQYANDQNEVWLDFTTDAEGDADAESTVQWQFRPGEGRSLVIHEKATATQAGEAGTAGARLACVTLY